MPTSTRGVRLAVTALVVVTAGAGLLVAPAPAHAAEHVYGAIAISQRTGNTAYAINYATASAAKRAAEAKCRTSDCRWVVQMARNCGAVTQQPRTLRWGWAYAPTRRSAEVAAANESGPGSRTITWACTAGA